MSLVDMLASVLVLLAGAYLVGLGAVVFTAPAKAKAFLGGFASSPFAHYLELSVRLVIGAALLRSAPKMLFPGPFSVFGWVLVVTTIALFAVPWQWHQRLARWAVPQATRHMRLFGVGSVVGGVLVILAVLLGRR